MQRVFTLIALPVALALASPLAAQTVAFGGSRADTSAPVEMTADTLTVDQSGGQAVFTGNVLIGQGEMRLSADKVTVTYAAGGQQKIQSLTATGGVTLVNGPDAAEAAEAVYDVATGNVTLTGDVVMTQGRNVLSGERMLVNLADGTAQVQGRVRSVLQPGGN
ncbi:lipopolysaccharide transport periplasmic protein LptA [Paracoccus luteus]|uniref:lipopolysaccharide transport periplasmic protein LptA n=1 Tax=Paracoccus luteus TaxID=2508543 RepID=UPI00106F5E79|nr:lipopolysaccharide transport periplasmic protein LptA [Paracoccus luteus]